MVLIGLIICVVIYNHCLLRKVLANHYLNYPRNRASCAHIIFSMCLLLLLLLLLLDTKLKPLILLFVLILKMLSRWHNNMCQDDRHRMQCTIIDERLLLLSVSNCTGFETDSETQWGCRGECSDVIAYKKGRAKGFLPDTAFD